jgi:hypothetical protein
MAASPRSMMSVITELPFLKSIPPRAGSRANAKGVECHAEESLSGWMPGVLGFGKRRSSVED